jgi:hypothetical protein
VDLDGIGGPALQTARNDHGTHHQMVGQRSMRILIFHGYLLRGTGSNIYNANLARTLARLGHQVDRPRTLP